MTSPPGFKVSRAVSESRHSRNQLRQKGRRLTTVLLRDIGINLRPSESRFAVSRGVLGRRRITRAQKCHQP